MVRRLPILAFAGCLAACGAADNEPGPGGVTVGEARMLDEAAEMIDERREQVDAILPEEAPPLADNNAAPDTAD